MLKRKVQREFSRFGEAGKWLIYGIAIGIVAGLGASIFFYLLQLAEHHTMETLAGYEMVRPAGEQDSPAPERGTASLRAEGDAGSGARDAGPTRVWVFLLLPALGGLLSGILVYTFAPEAEGHGTDAMIDAFHNKRGAIRPRVPYVKAAASIITLATGGSAGREGPIAQIGGGFGSWLGGLLRLNARERRIMLLAGTAGGLGAIFRAPLGGAITAIEVLYREDFESDALLPSITSSVTAYAIFSQLFGFAPIFSLPPGGFRFAAPLELIFYAWLGLLCAPSGMAYVKTFYGVRDFFRRLPVPRVCKPMLGGLGLGLLFLLFSCPQVFGTGWGQIQKAIDGNMEIGLMASLVVLKIIGTSFTVGSGGSGGVFGPSLFIGAMLGGVVGHTSHLLFPGIVAQPGAFVIVGMVGFFAGVASAPIGALLMAVEMTGGYGLLAPLLVVSVVAVMFNRRWSIYEKQVANRFQSPAHLGDFTVDVLQELRVKEVMRPDGQFRTVPQTMTLGEFRALVATAKQPVFSVVDRDGKSTGWISIETARVSLFELTLPDSLIVDDIVQDGVFLRPEDDLHHALTVLIRHEVPVIPVVVRDTDTVTGYLFHTDVSNAYHNEIVRRRHHTEGTADA